MVTQLQTKVPSVMMVHEKRMKTLDHVLRNIRKNKTKAYTQSFYEEATELLFCFIYSN